MSMAEQDYYKKLVEKTQILQDTVRLVDKHDGYIRRGETEETWIGNRMDCENSKADVYSILGKFATDEETYKIRVLANSLLQERIKKLQADLKSEFSS